MSLRNSGRKELWLFNKNKVTDLRFSITSLDCQAAEWESRPWGFKVLIICGALYDLAPFVQFKKREKHP